jgi:hypothetical protein
MLRNQHVLGRQQRRFKMPARIGRLLRVLAPQERGNAHIPFSLSHPNSRLVATSGVRERQTNAVFTGRTNPRPPSRVPQSRSEYQARRCAERRRDTALGCAGCAAGGEESQA